MSDRRTIARNTAFNAAGRIWEAVAAIGLTIYVIDRVGLEGFGLWSLVAVFTGYAALFDFGVSSAFTTYIASFAARDDRPGVNAVVSTGVVFYAMLGVLIVGLGWPLVDVLIAGTLKVMHALNPGHTQIIESNARWEEVRTLLRGALVLFAAGNCAAPFSALQSGLQRMGLSNAIGFASSLVKVVATIFFLESGLGVLGLLYASAVVLAFTTVVNVIAAYRIFPGLRCNPSRIERHIFGVLLSFGWRSQVARLANLINFQTDRMVVAVATGGNLDLVGVFRVGEDLAAKVRQLPVMMVSALVPAVSSLDARNDRERLRTLYARSTKYVAAVTAPAALYLLACADLLLSLYAEKSSLGAAGWVARITILGYVLNVLPGPGVCLALGKGNAGLPMKAGLISMVGNIALTIALYAMIGFYGIPLGTALALGLSTLWFFSAMRREVAVPPLRLLRESLLWPVVASLPGFALCVAVNVALAGYDHRIGNLLVAAVCGGLFGLSYVACLRWTPFMDRYDVSFLRETLHMDRVPGFRFLTARAEHVG
jgi:O-antigen/teichoic acid export membrane protein